MKLDHCAAHADSADLGMSCYRIRHDDGRIATPAEIWAAMVPRQFEIAKNGFGDNGMMDIEAELRGYAVDHAPDGWPAIRMDKLMQAANEIDRLRSELIPAWNDAGEAATLAAAAEDALEWLDLIDRLHGSGAWKFSSSENLQRLRGCQASLRARLRHNV